VFKLPACDSIKLLPEITVCGLRCSIETRKHETRHGKNFSHVLPADYGFIQGYIGADGDEIDCYVGSNRKSGKVWVVDQNKLSSTSKFDEHKVMLGYSSRESAFRDYLLGHTYSHKIFRGITSMTMEGFKKWLENGDLTKPLT